MISGAAHYQVFQRDAADEASIAVNGRLVAPVQVSGFTVRREDGTNDELVVIRQELDANDPHSILLHLCLWYGWGTCSFCDVADELDMSLPLFGPVPIPRST